MTFKTVLLEVDSCDHVATITLNRPQALNAFNRTMCLPEMGPDWAKTSGTRARDKRNRPTPERRMELRIIIKF